MKFREKLFHTFENKFSFAYARLTLFYVLIIMTISIVFSVVIFNTSTAELQRGLGRQNTILRDTQILGNSMMNNFPDLEQFRRNQISESTDHLKNELILCNLIILILSSLGGYFFARKTLEPIEKAMDSQNRFTADASHELRTPLTAMKTEIEVAVRDKGLKITDAKSLLSSNLEEIEKLESLTSSLLNLARYQDEADKNFEHFCLNNAITEAYEKVEHLALKKNIIFETNLDECSAGSSPKLTKGKNSKLINSMIYGDEHSLAELFTILFDNAIKYSPEKSKIKILVSNDGNKTIVKVRDRGVGIKSSDLPFIFNRFYRADTSRSKEKADGYGLGLSIAKNIVDFHHAEISVKSKIGTGTEFTIVFNKH